MYSIVQILHPRKDKDGRQKIQIRVIYNRTRVYLKTDFKTGSNNIKINASIRKQMTDAEDLLLDAIRSGPIPAAEFKGLFKKEKAKSIYLVDYIGTLTERLKLSKGTLNHYRSLGNKVGMVKLSEIDVPWLERFQKSLLLDGNTINANMKRFKSILFKAAAEGFIKEDQFKRYKVPAYKQKLVDYLTEKEVAAVTKIVKAVNIQAKKVAGYYFLLSCFTGWRISDVKRFNPSMIHGDSIVIRAKKNGQIVSFPIIPRLKEVLKFVVKNPFNIPEQTAREYIKEIARDAGITKKIKFHSSRHTFGMILMSNGFTMDEIAEKLGDSVLISKVYARIDNPALDKKIRERLG